jgi:uncharacterized protein (TIGR01244 family)
MLATLAAAQNVPSLIYNFLRVDKQICTGGQPTLEQLETLKAQGVRAVINLRLPSEHNAAEEEARVKQLRMRYINIPVDREAPTAEQAETFLKALRDPKNRPAFIHCAAANRVGAFWMIYRVVADGWTIEKAEEEARKVGMRGARLRQFALDYIASRQKK